jgi:hypothetical protein
MLTIKRVEAQGTCAFCAKDKEVAAVVMDGQPEVLLCWGDRRKHAQMRMRMTSPSSKPAAPAPSPAPSASGATK